MGHVIPMKKNSDTIYFFTVQLYKFTTSKCVDTPLLFPENKK